tara:strand:- start:6119 stop:6241 length:123 start_codon:yes stop_codon:yes gene_type:complete
MTVSQLRINLTEEELMYFAAYYEIRHTREEAAMKAARHKK